MVDRIRAALPSLAAWMVTASAMVLSPVVARSQEPMRHGASPDAMPTEVGQATFAAIAEIVSILENDPDTDWTRVDIAALREHLVDMNRVMVDAQVAQRPIKGGVEMTVTGGAPVMASARRMIQAHTAMVAGRNGWNVDVTERPDALVVTWTTSDEPDVARIRALGFFGFLAQGSHHQRHHLMIARGMNPHGGMH